MRGNDESILMPRNPAPYLVEWLFDIGPVSQGFSGGGKLSWSELAAWSEQTGVALLPWEARVIRRLSAQYADECHEASSPDRAPPYAGEKVEDIKQRRAAVDRKIDMMFRSLKKKAD